MKRRFSIASLAALTVLFCSGVSTPANGQRAPRPQNTDPLYSGVNAVVYGSIAIVGVIVAGVVVIVAVNHDHHVLKGCASSGPNGLQLQTSNSETYLLEGDPSAIKAGHMVKLHGSKAKSPKGSKSNRVFIVEELKKDYGSCNLTAAPAAKGMS